MGRRKEETNVAKAATAEPKSELAQFASKVKDPWPLPLRQDWEEMSLDDAHVLIQKLHASYTEGAGIFNQRTSNQARADGFYKCMVCGKRKADTIDNHPNYVWREDRKDQQTGIYTTQKICTTQCYFRGANSGQMTKAGMASNVHK